MQKCIRSSVKDIRAVFNIHASAIGCTLRPTTAARLDRFCALLHHICLVFDSLERFFVIKMLAAPACSSNWKGNLRHITLGSVSFHHCTVVAMEPRMERRAARVARDGWMHCVARRAQVGPSLRQARRLCVNDRNKGKGLDYSNIASIAGRGP